MGRATTLEIASGVVVGVDPDTTVAGSPPRRRSEAPWIALQRVLEPALRRPPCLISFSGGLDSTLVLAAALAAAKELGLPEPLPCTWRFPLAAAADETALQDEMLRAIGVRDRITLTAGPELDLVGPVAQTLLNRHGVSHPVNLHLHLPILEQAVGGSVVTGFGGDQILGGWRPAERYTPTRWAKDRIPGGFRARRRRRRSGSVSPWLHDHVADTVAAAMITEAAGEPRRFDQRVRWHAERRNLTLSLAELDRVGDDLGVAVSSPLTSPRFVDALVGFVGDRPAPARTELIAAIIANRPVPAVVARPRDKAHFLDVFFTETTRDHVRSWDGSGVDPDLVDIRALQREWSRWPVPPRTAGLVQQTFLAARHPAESPDRRGARS